MPTQDDIHHSPTMPPRQGALSSKGVVDFGVQIGQYVIHRGPTEWLLDRIPDQLGGPLRRLVAKGFREIGKRTMMPETELQEAMNKKLFMNIVDEESGLPLMAEVNEDYLKELFPHGKQEAWPSQLVVCTKDVRPDPALLRQTMLYFPDIASDVLGTNLDVVTGFEEERAGRVVVIGSYNTDKDVLHNASAVLDRTQEIKKSPRSIAGISDAAIKAGESLLDMMTLRQEFGATVLRDDAPDMMRHIMTHGYSQGGNIATDIFRYMRAELMSGRYEMALDALGEETVNMASDKEVSGLLGNSYVYTIAAAEVPYHDSDLTTLPPRDNSRSDGDLVISAAVGTNRKQSNYNRSWQQDREFLGRNDRLLETIGPKKRLFGLAEPRGTGYHSMLGHGDDQYRDSVVEHGGELLKERLAPRFLGSVMATDVTFSPETITVDFERGTPPKQMQKSLRSLKKQLKAADIKILKAAPYQLQLGTTGDEKTLKILREAMKESGVEQGEDVNIALNAELVATWLSRRLKKLPDTSVDITATEHGPALHVQTGGSSGGAQVQGLLKRGLERVGLTAGQRTENGGIEIPLQDAVHAFKLHQQQEREAGYGR